MLNFLFTWSLQITVDTDRTVVAFYKFLKKNASIPFKLQKPASPPKSESTDAKETPESSTPSPPKSESTDAKETPKTSTPSDLKDEL